jgi:hypothetical protein
MARLYRGYEIRRTQYQGLSAYYCPALAGGSLAANLKTIRKWIDAAIAAGELARIN